MGRQLTVDVNDHFVKTEFTDTVWVVRKEVGLATLPKHWQLYNATTRRGTLTMSESALLDKDLFQRVEPAQHRV
ncbi:MAG: hypothetical protein ACPGO3_11305 [Magnetospiraceae bacterium]